MLTSTIFDWRKRKPCPTFSTNQKQDHNPFICFCEFSHAPQPLHARLKHSLAFVISFLDFDWLACIAADLITGRTRQTPKVERRHLSDAAQNAIGYEPLLGMSLSPKCIICQSMAHPRDFFLHPKKLAPAMQASDWLELLVLLTAD